MIKLQLVESTRHILAHPSFNTFAAIIKAL